MDSKCKIAIVSERRQIPDYLQRSLDYYRYTYCVECDIEQAIQKNYDVFVIDTSIPSANIEKVRRIPGNKCSFFAALDVFDSPSKSKYIIEFLSKVESDRSVNHKLYSFFGETPLSTRHGDFIYFGFKSRISQKEVIGVRTPFLPEVPDVRVHSMCYTGDIFHSLRCNCREELEKSLTRIQDSGGILIYSQDSGRGIGALNKIKVYQHQKNGADTVEAQYLENFPNDLRTYDYLKDVFSHFAITKIKLITSNPVKVSACQNAGVVVVETIKILSTVNEHNRDYLKTKMDKNNHNFHQEFSTVTRIQ